MHSDSSGIVIVSIEKVDNSGLKQELWDQNAGFKFSDKLVKLSVPQFPCCKMRTAMVLQED